MRNNNLYKIKVNFIRHGKTPANTKHLYISHTDESLSEAGIKEIEDKTFPACDYLFTSGLKRCNETAKIIYEKNDIIEIPNLSELDFGSFEMRGYDELKDDPNYIEWIDKRGELAPPNGESKGDFIKRVLRGFDEVLSLSKNAKEISLVVHGGTIMGIISSYTELDYYDVQIKCAEVISCDVIFGENNGVIFISHFGIVARSGS